MNRTGKYIMLPALVAITLMLQPRESLAYDGPDIGISDASSYVEYSSQISRWGNISSHHSFDMLGIAEMDYIGDFTYGADGPRWLFKTEPEILKIDEEGPSYGKLKKGDKIVAIDGGLITTEKAGLRFANLVAGETAELEIRRSGRKYTMNIIPRFMPEPVIPIELIVRCTEQSRKDNAVTILPGKIILPEFGPLIEKFEKRQKELWAKTDSMGILASPEYIDRAPRGWIGFGLSFSGSIRRNDGGKPADWLFFDTPSIKSIYPGSPADKAGLKVDDVLLEIDGNKLDSEKGGEKFSQIEPGQLIEWKVVRGDETFKVETRAEKRPKGQIFEPDLDSFDQDSLQPVRYTGTLGDTEIEVRGDRSVRVDVDEKTGETIIRSGDSVVRLKSRGER